jgi:glucokinase
LTEARRGPAAVLESVKHVIRDLSSQTAGIAGIGVAVAGQVHPQTQAVVAAPNLGWRNFPLRDEIASAFHVPVWVENDVRGAAWGEFRFGHAAGARSLLAVFVGSGVGSGAVLDGAIWHGAGNAAGEVGHTQVVADGLPCPCGQRGCMEQYTSGNGLQRRLALGLASEISTRLAELTGGDATRLSARVVFQAAAAGDAFAGELWSDVERHLVTSLANYVTVLNPEVLVLGGGVIETVPELFDTVVRRVPELTTEMARATLRIERAALGDWSGVVGAADLARPAAVRGAAARRAEREES